MTIYYDIHFVDVKVRSAEVCFCNNLSGSISWLEFCVKEMNIEDHVVLFFCCVLLYHPMHTHLCLKMLLFCYSM